MAADVQLESIIETDHPTATAEEVKAAIEAPRVEFVDLDLGWLSSFLNERDLGVRLDQIEAATTDPVIKTKLASFKRHMADPRQRSLSVSKPAIGQSFVGVLNLLKQFIANDAATPPAVRAAQVASLDELRAAAVRELPPLARDRLGLDVVPLDRVRAAVARVRLRREFHKRAQVARDLIEQSATVPTTAQVVEAFAAPVPQE